MKNFIYLFFVTIFALSLFSFFSGCGGGGTTGVIQPVNQGTDTGSVEIHVEWPEGKDVTAQDIHPDVEQIEITITGTGLTTPMVETIAKGVSNKTITGIPVGLKQFEFKGKNAGGGVLSHRLTNVTVIKDQTVTVTAHLGVTISSTGFYPVNIPISPGDTIFWKNNDTVVHNVVADDASFNSGDIAVGAEWSHVFPAAGTFTYKCTKTGKAGSVVVGGSVDPNSTESYVFVRKWGSLYSLYGNRYLAVDSSDNIYVADANNNMVQKYDPNGFFITEWGTMGDAGPTAIGIDSSDNVYIADYYGTNRIQKFNSTGNFITKWDNTYSAGGIGIDNFDNIYIAENMLGADNHIKKFNSSGDLITEWVGWGNGVSVDSLSNVYITDTSKIVKTDSSGNYITGWGSWGSDNGQFLCVYGIAIDSSNNIYVTEVDGLGLPLPGNHRIQKFDSSGGFITKWGSDGYEDGQLGASPSVILDSQSNVYIADTYKNARIQKFNSTGNFITKWQFYGNNENSDGKFDCPNGISIDSSGNIYIMDSRNSRIQKFNSTGTFVSKWGKRGVEDGEFTTSSPSGITVGTSANIYIVDASNYRIQKFNSNGGFISKWGIYGNGDGQFADPSGITVDLLGNVYVSDTGNHRIQVFAPSP